MFGVAVCGVWSYYSHLVITLCISQFHLCPAPPGNCGAFARLVSPGGGGHTLSIFISIFLYDVNHCRVLK